MKKLLRSIKRKNTSYLLRIRDILKDNRGEGYIDTAIVILISVVLGALLLAGLYALFGNTVLPEAPPAHGIIFCLTKR